MLRPWILRRSCLGTVDSHVHVFFLTLLSILTVDRWILDWVLSSFGLLAFIRHAYFEHHAHA